jgi:1-acyl-sn-glycerol-3-phosphate acyltransferase
VAEDGTAVSGRAMRRRRPRRGFWYGFAISIVQPILLAFTRRRWTGAENIPPEGGFIIAANHISHVDPFTLAHFLYDNGCLPRYLAKSELWKIFFVKRVMAGAKQIPVYRRTSDAGLALRDAVTALESGECVVVYPEGSTTKDPAYWPMKARTGVARLALMSGAPVIPLAQWGPQEIFGQDRKFHLLRRHTIAVAAGPPVDLSAYAGKDLTTETLRAATEQIMMEVRRLVGELRGEVPPAAVFDPRVGDAPLAGERRSA